MAIGVQGPISPDGTIGVGDHGLVDYSMARSFRILSADRNQQVASCKVCGVTLAKDTGFKVLMSGLLPSSPKNCYVCRRCFGPIKAANEAFPVFDPLPSWWKILDSNKPREERSQASSLPPDEIERMIKQREKRRRTQ